MPHRLSPSFLRVMAIVVALAGILLVLVALRPSIAPAGGDPGALPADAPTVFFPDSHAFVVVELARTDAERQRGLMGRTSLEDGTGMLFVFPRTVSSAFWMKDTLIPLSIAFIDEQGVIVDIQDMQPLDETLHYPADAYRYALEVPQGWFSRAGVVVGQHAQLPAEAVALEG
jgi:uncharacterized membrane protein (UPF0127 family)